MQGLAYARRRALGPLRGRAARRAGHRALDRQAPHVLPRRGRVSRGRPGRLVPSRHAWPVRGPPAHEAGRYRAAFDRRRGRGVRRACARRRTRARSTTVTALEVAATRAVYSTDFARLRHDHPAIDSVLVALLADQVRRLSQRVLEAYYVDAEARVRLRLLELATTYGGDDPAPPVTVPLTQEDIASLAGTSRATVNRVLREEQQHGTIALGRGRTVLLDIASLARRRR